MFPSQVTHHWVTASVAAETEEMLSAVVRAPVIQIGLKRRERVRERSSKHFGVIDNLASCHARHHFEEHVVQCVVVVPFLPYSSVSHASAVQAERAV